MGALTDYIVVALAVLVFRIYKPDVRRPFKCPAIYLVAPIALLSSGYLLSKQIIGDDGSLLDTGRVYLYWIGSAFAIYVAKLGFDKIKNS